MAEEKVSAGGEGGGLGGLGKSGHNNGDPHRVTTGMYATPGPPVILHSTTTPTIGNLGLADGLVDYSPTPKPDNNPVHPLSEADRVMPMSNQ